MRCAWARNHRLKRGIFPGEYSLPGLHPSILPQAFRRGRRDHVIHTVTVSAKRTLVKRTYQSPGYRHHRLMGLFDAEANTTAERLALRAIAE